jgi:hypothetical protein
MAKARQSSRRAFSSGISRPVSRVLYGGVAPTWQPFLWDVCCQTPQAANPDDWSEENRLSPRHPYLALLPVGFALPLLLPATRCALTAPFHPYLVRRPQRFVLCGTFPGVAPAGRYPAPFLRGARTFLDDCSPRLPGRLTHFQWARGRTRSRKMARTFPSAPDHRECFALA